MATGVLISRREEGQAEKGDCTAGAEIMMRTLDNKEGALHTKDRGGLRHLTRNPGENVNPRGPTL